MVTRRRKKKNMKGKRRQRKRRTIVLNADVAKRKKRSPAAGRGRSSAGGWRTRAAASVLCAAALVIGVCLGIAHGIFEPAGFTVRWVEVSNESLLDEGEVVRLSGITFGQGLLSLDLQKVKARICAHPDVKDAVISRALPAGIRIRVFERFPVAAIYRGKRHVVDGEGVVLSAEKERRNRSLPVLVGCRADDLRPGNRLASASAARALSIVRKYRDSDLCRLMDLVSVDIRDPDNTVLRTRAIEEIRLGRGDIGKRLDLLAYILKQRKSRGINGPARYIDLRWNDVTEMPQKRVKG